MTEPWRIRLLGGLGAFQGDRTVTRFRTQKTGLLLAYLAFHTRRDHAREVLLEALWPESDLSAARNSLSVALNSLRKQLEPPATPGTASTGTVLIADRTIVRLRDDAFTTDVAAFEAARDAAAQMTDGDTGAVESLIAATKLYTGEFLPGFYDDWVLTVRERLADAHLQTLRRLSALLMQSRDFDRALDFAHQAVGADPLSETSRRLLMRIYAAVGRPGAVRETLRDLERLREAQGEGPPTAATTELAHRLAEGTDKEGDTPLPARLASRKRPDTASAASEAINLPKTDQGQRPAVGGLPLQFTRFFGRASEIEQITHLLQTDGARLVTLTGPGGAGKTRGAIEAAKFLQEHFPGGVFFAPLADVADPARLLDAVRIAFNLPMSSRIGPLEQIAEAVSDQPTLLVLDNLEHLLGQGPLDSRSAAAWVRSLLNRIPAVQILATSRHLLQLETEREVVIPPLPVPQDPHVSPETLLQSASVQLFADRARARRVDFQVTPNNAEATARLCARLEGIPLAIELAAAWAKLVTPSQMLQRLGEGLDLLESRRPDIPARQRSLRGAVAWSCDLLPPDVVRLFTCLSVFRGGATVEAIEGVCADESEVEGPAHVLDALTRLRDASLLIAETTGAGAGEEMRLRLLEPLREYADERLASGERDPLRDRHAAYFLRLAETAASQLQGPDQAAWFDRLEADHENFRIALELCIDTPAGLRMAGALGRFWKTRGYLREGGVWLDRALSAGEFSVSSEALAKAQSAAGTLAYDRGEFDTAQSFYEAGLATAEKIDDRRMEAGALGNLGNVAYRRGEYALARERYTESLRIHRDQNDTLAVAGALGNLGNVAEAEGDCPAALALHEESLVLSRALGDSRMTAYTLHNLGNLASRQGDLDRARPLYEESLPLERALGDRRGVASLLNSLGFLDLMQGNVADALPHFADALRITRSIGDKLGMLVALDGFFVAAARQQQYTRAVPLFAASLTHRAILSATHTAEEAAQFAELLTAARAALPAAAYDAAWSAGCVMTLEQAAGLAIEDKN